MNLSDVINDYHEMLTDEIAEETDARMRHELLESGLYFGDRPLCVVLRPHFYFEENWAYLRSGLETLLTAFNHVHQTCMNDADYRALLYLDHYEEELFSLDIGGPPPWSSSRLDTFYVVETGTLKVVEYNAETPAGIGYSDKLGEVFDELEPMKRMRQRFHMNSNPAMGSLYDSLLNAYKQWGGTDHPQIAILDWHDVPTLNEHEISRVYFESRGTRATLADPRELDYRDGQLWKDDFRIDMIYKRVLYSELVEYLGTNNAVLKAVHDRAVFITNSPSAKMMAKKASLAFLSDEQHTHLFTPAQQQAIRDHIPWTRVVEDRKTTYNGQTIDLLEFIAQNKHKLVIKPNDEYGGKGVIIGWEASDDGWESAIQQGLNAPYVVQERVQVVQRDYPAWIDGQLDISPRFVDADPYVFNGTTVYGCMTRLSPLALLNVTAGGGSIVPAYILREK